MLLIFVLELEEVSFSPTCLVLGTVTLILFWVDCAWAGLAKPIMRQSRLELNSSVATRANRKCKEPFVFTPALSNIVE